MLAALRERLNTASDKVMERIAGPLAMIMAAYDTAMPYCIQAFHYGFIPVVVFLGWSYAKLEQPKLSLIDLLTPM